MSPNAESSTVRSVAVVGVGAMGFPVAMRLARSGFEVLACDRNRAALDRLAEWGVRPVDGPGACAVADVVAVLVATPSQVREVVAGIGAAASRGHEPVVLVMSTVPAELVIDLQDELGPLGIRVLDAPISGGVLRAEAGTLAALIGGGADDVIQVRPVLDAIAAEVFHCGALGSAATLKIVNNIIGTAAALVMAEACRLAVERGLDLDATVRVLEASSGRTYLTANPGEAAAFYERITHERDAFDALRAIMRKDFGLAVELADASPGEYPLVHRLKEFADGMGEETYANWQTVGAGRATGAQQ